MSELPDLEELGVAQAKARFSELIDRVAKGERFVVSRHGRPVIAIVGPGEAAPPARPYSGLAAVAGGLADWAELPAVVADIYESRRRARDRVVPSME